MRVGVAEERSGNELAAQNHSRPDRFATRLGFSPLHSTSSWRELRLRAGGLPKCSHCYEWGSSHSPIVTRKGNPIKHQARCHLLEAGPLLSLGKSENHPPNSLQLLPTY